MFPSLLLLNTNIITIWYNIRGKTNNWNIWPKIYLYIHLYIEKIIFMIHVSTIVLSPADSITKRDRRVNIKPTVGEPHEYTR